MDTSKTATELLLTAIFLLELFIVAFIADWFNRYGIGKCANLVNKCKGLIYKKKVITRGADREPYLIRRTIRPLTCKFFSVKIHKILVSDYQCLHDHPWAFVTFLIKGGYVEYNNKGSKVYSRFSLLYRSASYQHRLEIHQPVWSIVITFKKVRPWGFITPSGWKLWKDYTPSNICE